MHMSPQRTSEFIVEEVLPEVRKGRMVILVDSAERENEGDADRRDLKPHEKSRRTHSASAQIFGQREDGFSIPRRYLGGNARQQSAALVSAACRAGNTCPCGAPGLVVTGFSRNGRGA